MMHVTELAVDRWIEHVGAPDSATARRAMEGSSRAIDCAARFGARIVKLGNGARLILDADRVVTVLQRGRFAAAAAPERGSAIPE